jgi:hypothetical protein
MFRIVVVMWGTVGCFQSQMQVESEDSFQNADNYLSDCTVS